MRRELYPLRRPPLLFFCPLCAAANLPFSAMGQVAPAQIPANTSKCSQFSVNRTTRRFVA